MRDNTGAWIPDTIWAGEPAFVIGGGSSLAGFDFCRLNTYRIIAVNAAAYDVPAAAILYFGDTRFFVEHRALIDAWPGMAVSVSPVAEGRVLRLATKRLGDLAPGEPVRLGRSSGQTAVALAAALGARLIVLLGFDGGPVEGRWHYHGRYAQEIPGSWSEDLRRSWRGWGAVAAKAGVEIWNASTESVLQEFPRMSIDEALARIGFRTGVAG